MRLSLVKIIGLCLTTLMALAGDDTNKGGSPHRAPVPESRHTSSNHGFARC